MTVSAIVLAAGEGSRMPLAVVRAKVVASVAEHAAGAGQVRAAAFDEARVVVVRDEADIL